MLKIRRSRDRVNFNMGIPYQERRSIYWNMDLTPIPIDSETMQRTYAQSAVYFYIV